jgi:hypothetical protein
VSTQVAEHWGLAPQTDLQKLNHYEGLIDQAEYPLGPDQGLEHFGELCVRGPQRRGLSAREQGSSGSSSLTFQVTGP